MKPYLPKDVVVVGGFRRLLLHPPLIDFKGPCMIPHLCSFKSAVTTSEFRL